MSCSFAGKISSLIDSELPAAEARSLEHHLVDCVECRQLRADFLILRGQLSSFSPSVNEATTGQALRLVLARAEANALRQPNTSRAEGLVAWLERLVSFGFAQAAVAAALILAGTLVVVLYVKSHNANQNTSGRSQE